MAAAPGQFVSSTDIRRLAPSTGNPAASPTPGCGVPGQVAQARSSRPDPPIITAGRLIFAAQRCQVLDGDGQTPCSGHLQHRRSSRQPKGPGVAWITTYSVWAACVHRPQHVALRSPSLSATRDRGRRCRVAEVGQVAAKRVRLDGAEIVAAGFQHVRAGFVVSRPRKSSSVNRSRQDVEHRCTEGAIVGL